MLGHLILSILDNLGIFRLIKRYISAPLISASEFHYRQLLLDGAWEAYPALEGGAAGMDGGRAQGATNRNIIYREIRDIAIVNLLSVQLMIVVKKGLLQSINRYLMRCPSNLMGFSQFHTSPQIVV
jgi:hypothetical protein